MRNPLQTLGKTLLFLIALTLKFVLSAHSQDATSVSGAKKSAEISPEVKDLLHFYEKQIYFTQNEGQWPSSVVFKAEFPLGQAVATKKGMIVGTYDANDMSAQYDYGMREEEARKNHTPFTEPKVKVRGHAWMMNFVNSSPLMTIESKTRHSDVFNYFNGNASGSKTGVNNFQEVWYSNVYNHVDVRYYPSQEGTLEYDMICKPGFNKNNIAIQFDGIPSLSLKKNGSIVLKTTVGEMTLPAPVAYQIINGKKVSVDAHYVISGNVVKFNIGNYDATQTLIVDPIALRWATLINSNSTGDNHGHCIWVDPTDGAIYVVARVMGSTNFITTGAFDESANGNLETIIGKYTEPDAIGGTGSRVWQTYVGGNGDDNPYAMEQGPDGNLYITGYTSSTNFPLIGGSAFSGSSIDDGAQQTDNIFIVKISKDGNSIKSAVVGGNGDDGSFDLRFAPDGGIVVCGNTRSTNLNTLHPGIGASNTNSGNNDVLVFKINADLSTLEWINNYGGTGADQATIMLNNPDNGDIYVAGYTNSSSFPTVSPRQALKAGSVDGFIQKLNSSGAIVWSSYFNSAATKNTNILCMEFNTTRDKLYFAGITSGLNATNVPFSGVYDNSYNGGTNDFFVVSMDTNQLFNASTYIGGIGNEVNMMGLNLDLNDDVFVFGYSNSPDFPVTSSAPQSQLNNTNSNGANPANDKVFLKLNGSLENLFFSTFYGGSADDYDPVGERGIKFSNCRIYTIVTGRSNNLPLTEGALTTSKESSTSVYEPGLVVWANPPDLTNNVIFGSQTICDGVIPSGFTGTEPSYVLPNISRNGFVSSYPVILPPATTYQWQRSLDSIHWANVPNGNTQNLDNSLIGNIHQKTFFRRIIGGDACVIAGAPDQLVIIKMLSMTANVNNVSCYGYANGSITVHPDGTPNYNYVWNTGAISQTVSNLGPGTYSVIMTDGSGCSASDTFHVTQPLSAVSAVVSSSPATCDNKNGSVSVVAAGGTPGYSYLWSNGTTDAQVFGLLAGVYWVSITDATGCSITVSDTVHHLSTFHASESHTPILCHGNTSIVTISATGGTAPYDGIGTYTQAAGTATYSVTDANGCHEDVVVCISEPETLSASEVHNELFCYGNSSTVTISASGGTVPYSGTGTFTQNTGEVTYTITDANGCSTQVTATIAAPPVFEATCSSTSASDYNTNDGSVGVVANGGTGAYSYLWSNGATDASVNGLSSGTFTVTVTDAKGCNASCTTTMNNFPLAVDDVNTTIQNTPVSGNSATNDIPSIDGGNIWSLIGSNGGASHGTVTMNSAGGYTYTPATNYQGIDVFTYHLCDINGDCSTAIVTITINHACNLSLSAVCAKPLCHSSADGICNLTVTGAQGAVTFLWNDGSTTQNRTGLTAGSYTITATDAAGCSTILYKTIGAPLAINIAETHTNVSFHNGHNGSIDITATGGSGHFSYLWSDGIVKADRHGLYAGAYTVTVTDKHGCTTSKSITITQPQRGSVPAEDQLVKLYPNPATNQFIVELNLNTWSDASFNIQLINTIGQIVAERTGNFANGILHEVFETNSRIASGMYEVQIIWDDQIVVQPLVISK